MHIFCDFDGTITEEDVLIMVLGAFAPPVWQDIHREIMERRITLRQGVGRLFGLLPSSLAPAMVDHVRENVRLRAGFPAFLGEATRRGWKLDVVSGGLDLFVDPVLAPYLAAEQIHRGHLDLSGELMQVTWPEECVCDNGCGTCKPAFLRRSGDRPRILIGDGLSDLPAAREAELVLAMGSLGRYLEEERRTFIPVRDFDDCLAALAEGGLGR